MSDRATVPIMPHPAVWLTPVGMLIGALLPLPYGFYTALRIVVCVATCYLAYFEYKRTSRASGWSILMIVLAIIFNPLLPIHLNREIWAAIDIGAAIALIVHWRQAHRSANAVAAGR